jgi:hypothetical protein
VVRQPPLRISSFYGSQILPIEIVTDTKEGLFIVELALLYPELWCSFLEIDTYIAHATIPFTEPNVSAALGNNIPHHAMHDKK